MRLDRYKRYQVVRTQDGNGGVTETLSNAVSISGAVEIYQNEPTLTYRYGATIYPGDIIETSEGAQYRITEMIGNRAAPFKRATLSRIDRPIHPERD